MIYGIRKTNAVRPNSLNNQKLAETRSLRRYNKVRLEQDLQGLDWVKLLGPLEHEPSKMVATSQDVFESLLNKQTPLRIKKLRNEFTAWPTSYDLMTKNIR